MLEDKTQLTRSGKYGVDLESLPKGFLLDNRYKIETKIGTGGFGTVYKAWDDNLDTTKAIKVISKEFYNDEEVICDLKQEAKLLYKLEHKNIVKFHDIHLDGNIKYIDMEYIDNGNLVNLKLRSSGKKVPEKEVIEIVKQIIAGMKHIHSQNIIHKDIKPQNIMLTKNGTVKIMDFGISETFRSSMSRLKETSRSGTPAYMSPEQLIGKDVGKESDIWSFGVMLYELLAGKQLFTGKTTSEIHHSIREKLDVERDAETRQYNQYGSIIFPEGISNGIKTILQKCLQYNYKDRFRSFSEVQKFLERDFEAEKKEHKCKEKLQQEETERKAKQLIERQEKEQNEKFLREREKEQEYKKKIENAKLIKEQDIKHEKTKKEKKKSKKGLIWLFVIFLIISSFVVIHNINKQNKISAFILSAESYYNEDELENAKREYRQVLNLDSNNSKAKEGLKNIIQRETELTLTNKKEAEAKKERLNNSVTDIDGNVFKTVTIGNQVWMAENLKVTHYRNGDPIPNVTHNKKWAKLNTGAYGVYDNKPSNADTYGNLYNWYAVNDPRGLAPEGWHVPTDEEIKELEKYLGMSEKELYITGHRGTNQGSKLAGGDKLWRNYKLEDDSSFDASGFSLLPGGERIYSEGATFGMYHSVSFWSSTESNASSAWYRRLGCNSTQVGRHDAGKYCGFSVRCLQD